MVEFRTPNMKSSSLKLGKWISENRNHGQNLITSFYRDSEGNQPAAKNARQIYELEANHLNTNVIESEKRWAIIFNLFREASHQLLQTPLASKNTKTIAKFARSTK